MDIDITEIMKTGLFELRFEKVGSAEELVITPMKKGLMGDRYTPLHTVSYDPEDWAPEFDDVSSEFTDVESLKGSWEENIPWHMIPEKFNWVAQDNNGVWFGHQNRPSFIENGEWVSSGYVTNIDENMPTPPDWTESLVRRPSYEQKAT